MTKDPADPCIQNSDVGTESPADTAQNKDELPRGNRRIAELVFRLMTEGQTPGKQALAVGIGVLIGCIPVFGTHIFLVLVVGRLTRLSRIRMFAATWISNPFFAPVLVWAEFQVGHFVLTGRWMNHSVQSLSELGLAGLGWSLTIGTLVVGASLAILAALVVWTWIPRGNEVLRRRSAIEAAAYRYLDLGLLPWFHARQLLYGNPAIVDLATSGELVSTGGFIDLGCGQGELLALALESADLDLSGRCIGITSRSGCAERARHVLPSGIWIEPGNLPLRGFGTVDCVVVWNARRRDAPEVDDDLISEIRDSLNPAGLLVISWSKKWSFGPKNLDDVADQLVSSGFSIEHQISSTSLYRHWGMVVAQA